MKHIFTFIFFLLTFTACQSPPSCSTISGNYSGTSVMGGSSGSCSMQINSDCSAVLEYDHGSMGSAKENGTLEKTESGFRFISGNGGGKYDLHVNGTELTLEGYNWRCDMGKE